MLKVREQQNREKAAKIHKLLKLKDLINSSRRADTVNDVMLNEIIGQKEELTVLERSIKQEVISYSRVWKILSSEGKID